MSITSFLVGTWFICSTNFPMWLKGDKMNPGFRYELINPSRQVLSDEVSYWKNGKQKFIRGYDYPDAHNDSSFVWRGKGLLALLKSKWKVVLTDPEGKWAVIYFSKTLFTPEGIDIISRSAHLPEKDLNDIKNRLKSDPVLGRQLLTMRDLKTENQ